MGGVSLMLGGGNLSKRAIWVRGIVWQAHAGN